MSASLVRSTVGAWAQDVAAQVGVAFYASIAKNTLRPADAIWWTISFQAVSIEGDTFCAGPDYLEKGGVKVSTFAALGNGDADAVDALERIVRALRAKRDPTLRLAWTTFEPVFEEDGSGDVHFIVGVWLNYDFQLTQ